MNSKLRKFLFISVILYIAFLGWFFFRLKPSLSGNWRPSDIYNQVGDCPYASSSTTAPATEKVFDAKLSVPMKSVTARRKALRKRRSSMPKAKSALGKRNPALYSFAVTPVGGGLHMVSSAEFHSFGANGLMYMPMPQYFKRTNNNVSPSAQMLYQYLPMSINAQGSSVENSSQENVVVVPFYPTTN
jgi:hypothetical protein